LEKWGGGNPTSSPHDEIQRRDTASSQEHVLDWGQGGTTEKKLGGAVHVSRRMLGSEVAIRPDWRGDNGGFENETQRHPIHRRQSLEDIQLGGGGRTLLTPSHLTGEKNGKRKAGPAEVPHYSNSRGFAKEWGIT